MFQLREIVDGQSVALVGNSASVLRTRPAAQIDGHDVVIRMNLGLPKIIGADRVGSRTTIWATAKYWAECPEPADCKVILWMKLTALGERHLALLEKSQPRSPIFMWEPEDEAECREFVGADPGTGIRLLWWLKTKAQPRSVSCFGMDCWENVSHWSGKRNTPNHSPALEREAMLRLL